MWIIIIIIIVVIIAASASGKNNKNEKPIIQPKSEREKEIENLLLELVNNGIDALTSTDAPNKSKQKYLVMDVVRIIVENSITLFWAKNYYIKNMIDGSYEKIISDFQYDTKTIEKIKSEYEDFKQNMPEEIEDFPFDSIIDYSFNYKSFLQTEINKVDNEIKRREKPNSYDNQDGTIKFEVAGIKYRSYDVIERIKQLNIGEGVIIEPEPTNEYDKNAIGIKSKDGIFLGYVPKEALSRVHNIISSGVVYNAIVSRRTDHDIPYLWVLVATNDYDK